MGILDYDPFAAEKFANPAVKGILGDLATLPQRAIQNSQNAVTTGYYNPAPVLEAAMLPMGTGAIAGVPMKAGEGILGAGPIRAYHGSPHDFDRFSLDKIGTGEGAQAYGHGLYFADSPGVAETYRSKVSAMQGNGGPTIEGRPINWNDPTETAAFELTRHNGDRKAAADFYEKTFKGNGDVARILRSDAPLPEVKPAGRMYEVNINADPEHFLDWDKPLTSQTVKPFQGHGLGDKTSLVQGPAGWQTVNPASETYQALSRKVGPERASEILRGSGVPGIKYLDQGSRAAGEGSRNYVVFDDKLIDILKKYGIMGATIPTGGIVGNNMIEQRT